MSDHPSNQPLTNEELLWIRRKVYCEDLQARIEAALVDIEEWRLYGVVNSEAIATRLEAILKGETP